LRLLAFSRKWPKSSLARRETHSVGKSEKEQVG
jgi:hypothetical protein